MKTPRRTAAEIIAYHFNMDLAEMRDYRYQPTRWVNPAIYTMSFGDIDYVAAPANGKMPAGYADLVWTKIGEEYGRAIFVGRGEE